MNHERRKRQSLEARAILARAFKKGCLFVFDWHLHNLWCWNNVIQQPNCRFLTTKHVFKRSFLQGNHFLVVNFLGKNRGKSLQMMFIHISSRTYCEVSHLCLPSSRQAKLRLPLASWASWFPWVDTGHLDRSILQAYQNSVGTHAPLDDYWFLIFTFVRLSKIRKCSRLKGPPWFLFVGLDSQNFSTSNFFDIFKTIYWFYRFPWLPKFLWLRPITEVPNVCVSN